MKVVNSLWIGKELSAMELLTIQSYIDFGFDFQLWCYDDISNLPSKVLVKDANQIIPASKIFSYQKKNKFGHGKGSVSGFSDLFRYKLLYDEGGIWTDMDITCLANFNVKEDYFFRYHHQIGLVGNFMKTPKNAQLMLFCYDETLKQVNEHNTNWLLPIQILKSGIYQYHLEHFVQEISNIDSFPLVRKLYITNFNIPTNWKIIHWMNEEFRRFQLDKNKAIKNSIYHQLLLKHNIKHEVVEGIAAQKIKLKTSKLNYSIINLKARFLWIWTYFFK
jgi:hypothetical protein